MNASRYAKGTKVWVDVPGRGRVQALHLAPIVWHNYPYIKHQVRDGDTMPLLADSTYDNAKQYWLIAEMNPQVPHPDDLQYGDVIHIPSRGV